MVKYLHKLIFSMALSITSDFAISPQKENSPVWASKIKHAATVIIKSTKNRAVPILTVLYFFKTIATISVPPPHVPILNKIAELRAGSTIAKTNSSTGSPVKGRAMGTYFSSPLSATETSTLT